MRFSITRQHEICMKQTYPQTALIFPIAKKTKKKTTKSSAGSLSATEKRSESTGWLLVSLNSY